MIPEANQMAQANTQVTKNNSDQHLVTLPTISLPKGGGAIRGMGEKFTANPVIGTGSTSVPIATSPGRSGFGPQLSLSYDSGAGNSIFGFGWSLSLPSISRKTDRGLPRYQDAGEPDVFILSGAEDLVPTLVQEGEQWLPETVPPRTLEGQVYRIRSYRPRTEGLFARIEQWINPDHPEDTFWRSISKENITTWYGRTAESRIADPADPARIFTWLICQSYDGRGNAIVYEYARENHDNVDRAQAHERHRVSTSNQYLKRICYGNRTPNRDAAIWEASDPAALPPETWMFEVVFDYGEGHFTEDAPDDQERIFARSQIKPPQGALRPVRQDPFSTYRAGFEVRTYRLCRRVLMFHHFPDEPSMGADCLVRSTEFSYSESPVASFLTSVTQSGYVRQPDTNQPDRYLKKSLPPVAFVYSRVPTPEELAQQPILKIDSQSLENLPAGLDGASYQWIDLDGEGASGILTEQASGWFYKRNLSANNQVRENGQVHTVARLGPVEVVAKKPAADLSGSAQFLDLAGDGQADLAQMEGPVRGFYERTGDASWTPFQPFTAWPDLDMRDPNLRFIDLTGDGHADILITEGDVLTWYPSLGEAGFGPAVRLSQPFDEEQGPRLVFADGEQAVYQADLSGDGLGDLVRIRNGEVCYWPNQGYGRFSEKVTMDNAPWFDAQDQFDQRRIRLVDTDGSGLTDILYLHHDGVRLYFNQSGNGWSSAVILPQFPPGDNFAAVQVFDLLGNGTACLVWSSPLPGDARQPVRYLPLMEEKPHLMVGMHNNLGAETRIQYAPSTKFYLDDKLAGKPWVTRLPFPVHVVERVETFDHISRNRFVTRYSYHHGCFDGVEREFRGFGRVEQVDTEAFAALSESEAFPTGENIDPVSHVPPIKTITWFHTGMQVDRNHVSNYFAGLLDNTDTGEYYREPGLDDEQAVTLLLPDTVLPGDLTAEEEREACRALKGAMLRQEIYALDGTEKASHPYSVTEQNFTVRRLQPRGADKTGFAVFFTHPREVYSFHYERNPSDPRTQHALTLEVDVFGNVLKSAAVAYGRRQNAPEADLTDEDCSQQRLIHITANENTFTNPILNRPDDNRTPLLAESRTYELRKPAQEQSADGLTQFYAFDAVLRAVNQAADGSHEVKYEDFSFEQAHQRAASEPQAADRYFRRLIEQVRTLYRPDDMGAAQNDPQALLAFGVLEPLALPGESFQLAFTPGLITRVYQRPLDSLQPPGAPPSENLLPDPSDILRVDPIGGQAANRGGYVDLENNGHWWIASGRAFYSPNPSAAPVNELGFARGHFFLPHRTRDAFHTAAASTESTVRFDDHVLLMVETRDALGNTAQARNDYRVLAPHLLIDPNGNRSAAAFDALGMVAGTAVMGKEHEPDGKQKGDSLEGFDPDLTLADLEAFIDRPRQPSPNNTRESEATAIVRALLRDATTRIVYDLDRFRRLGEPPFAATIAREKHLHDLDSGEHSKLQVSFSYSDGFGREIQKKIQAEPGPLVDGGAVVNPRWVGSGWTIYNNKGKPVRQFEPFFSNRERPDGTLFSVHRFEFGVIVGVSPILFYDPLERVVATLHPNHTWEKVVFDPWQQTTFDVNDTVTLDPSTDADVKGFFVHPDGTPCLPFDEYQPTWHALRTDPARAPEFAARYPNAVDQANEKSAAEKTAAHANTPTAAHFDALGRPFLTLADNGPDPSQHLLFATRVELDIEGNQRAVIDALGRVVMRYDYDLLGSRIHQASMEAGERWMLNDVSGKPLYAWDSRDHQFRTVYDPLRRPLESRLRTGAAPEQVTGKTTYGESQPAPEANNLRGKVFEVRDQAGVATTADYDFKGNLLRGQRRLSREYKNTLDWSQTVPLETETYTSRTRYDALNRSIQSVASHSDRAGVKVNIVEPIYNEANLLEQVHAWLEQDAEPGVLLDPAAASMHAVANIDYDAKGQRKMIEYGNGASTIYAFDPETFRLVHLHTTRASDGSALQDLRYAYDPAGNITHIQDDAQQTIYFANVRALPSADYTYDALYRLIEATGREHLRLGNLPVPHSRDDALRVGLPHPNDGLAMGSYTEQYVYDPVGNFQSMIHSGNCPNNPCWTRAYFYKAPSQLEPGKMSNRLTSTTIGTVTETYFYDETAASGFAGRHGSMTGMPHLPLMQWDYRDELQATSQQVVSSGTPEITYYVYDAAGQRARKVTERQAPAGQTPMRKQERIYLPGFELYREYDPVDESLALEREMLQVMDDNRRVALVETRTVDTTNSDPAPRRLTRFQYGNHLGSASLELDDQAQIISYEEYSPYGSTTYQSVRSKTETPKRYRYTGMERDEENGLNYHGARYYASWLGRWTSCDPLVLDTKAFALNHGRSLNLYGYCAESPLGAVDPDGRDVHILVDTNGRDIDYAAIQTRKYEIEHSSRFDITKDSVYPVQVLDLGKLKDMVDAVRADAAKRGFGPTVEFSVWGHAGADGPAAARDNSGPFAVDRKQMSIDGWNKIDFGWKKGDSFAAFYGCSAADFAEKFVSGQQSKGLSRSGYFATASYPSLDPTSYVRDRNGWGVDAIAEDIKRGNRSVSASLGVWYLGIGKWDHRVNTLTGEPVIVRQMKWARPANWWVPTPSQPTTTPTVPSAPSPTPAPVPPQPAPKLPTGGVLI